MVTVGLPFCGFKVLSGLSFGGPFGAALVALGAVDAVLNLANLAGLLLVRRRLVAACALALAAGGAGGDARRRDLGAALDVALSFALVALMIGLGRIAPLPPDRLRAWNACVILNVLGAGLGRLGVSWRELSRAA